MSLFYFLFFSDTQLTVNLKNADKREKPTSDRLVKDGIDILNGKVPAETNANETKCLDYALETIGKGMCHFHDFLLSIPVYDVLNQ